ncbi:MAG: MoaD/ThiS family protein [Dehalococcoidia bacterium]|nr:MoaD/ThiS family protein [Dehalococcoidia bacterium]
MQLTVKAFALLKERLGTGQVVVELKEGATLGDLIRTLASKYGRDLENILLTDDGALADEVVVSLNDNKVDNADAKLDEGSIIFFIPPLSGGAK